jgi:CRISPR system Cascade subunit CasE
MYFSVLSPTPGQERAAVRQRLHDDAYGDHQWLWRLFPAPPGTPRDFLFRRQIVGGLPRYHLVSRRPPEAPPAAWQLRSRDYAPALSAGDRLAFELRASPTVRHGRDGKSKRHDVVMEAQKQLLGERGLTQWKEWQADEKPALYALVQQSCTAWLQRRALAAGFELDAASCVAEAYQQQGKKEAGSLQFSTVDLSGELTVTDPDVFTQTLFHGLGGAKAFGCGLLLVQRVG